ncbi:MAG: 50S ribosomal protein L28 [Ardenticatenales bacterium]|nr:50S ribosomal protein L28 [Ardenticatenales bacterium]
MARKCQVTGKGPFTAMNVSFSHRRTKKIWNVNLQNRRLYVPELGKFVNLKLSASALRTISKKGLSAALKAEGRSLADVM